MLKIWKIVFPGICALTSCATYAPEETPESARIWISSIQSGPSVYIVNNSVSCISKRTVFEERVGSDFQKIGKLNTEDFKDPPFKLPDQFRSHLETTLTPNTQVQIFLEGRGRPIPELSSFSVYHYELCSHMVKFSPQARTMYKFRYNTHECSVEAQMSSDGISYKPATEITVVPYCAE